VKSLIQVLLLLAAILTLASTAISDDAYIVVVGGGQKIAFPGGTSSFADEVSSFKPGEPPPEPDFCRPDSALGTPNYNRKKDGSKFTSLGKGGVLELEFTDNRLVDVEGDDLYIFEIGPTVEGTIIEISENGEHWISVGTVEGNTASLDIGPHVKSEQQFRFVRLTDDPTTGNHRGRTAGADIDAVGAIGSVPAP
jgi:OOP family OmpA-OmpF porin